MPPPDDSAAETATPVVRGGDTRVINFARRPAYHDVPPPPAVGDRVGPYRLQQELGRGVSCRVFRAWDDGRSCPVAVKVLVWADGADRAAALEQLRTEAAALARVNHPRVVRFVDVGFDPRQPFLATEYVEGRSLGDLVRDGGALPAAWAVDLVGQMADALGAVWRAGLVHRDVKPDNVLVGPNGTAKLIDFGLATAAAFREARGTAGPGLAGTAAYLPPEQARDAGGVDHRADIYALGATLYEVLTGQPPFAGKSRAAVILQHLTAAPEPPASRYVGVPGLASELCLWMMAKDPADRPQTADDLRHAFGTVAGLVGRAGTA